MSENEILIKHNFYDFKFIFYWIHIIIFSE
jgi:hypothetical protein